MIEVGETKLEYEERRKERRERLRQKAMHGKFFREVEGVAGARSWQWLRAGYLNGCLCICSPGAGSENKAFQEVNCGRGCGRRVLSVWSEGIVSGAFRVWVQ